MITNPTDIELIEELNIAEKSVIEQLASVNDLTIKIHKQIANGVIHTDNPVKSPPYEYTLELMEGGVLTIDYVRAYEGVMDNWHSASSVLLERLTTLTDILNHAQGEIIRRRLYMNDNNNSLIGYST